MTAERLPSIIIIVVGILALLKALWAILFPDGMRRVSRWWLAAAKQTGTLTGLVYMVIAVGLWVVVLLDQPLVNWLVTLWGVLFAFGAMLCFRKAMMEGFINAVILNRGIAWIRVMGVIMALLGLALIWVALRSL